MWEGIPIGKHYQRHNGPEDWVLLTKVTSLGHIASSKNKYWSNFVFRISTKHQLKNLNQTSASGLNFKILTKPSFRFNLNLNLNQPSAAKYWPSFSFEISPELQLQNFDQTFCSKTEQKFSLMTKLWLPNLHLTRFSALTSARVTTSTSFESASSHARVTSIKSTKQELVSYWVCQFVSEW